MSYRRLIEAGLSADRIEHRVANGQLQRLWRGVYAFGHRELKPEGHLLAAVLAAGQGAVIGFRSAVAHWQLVRRLPGTNAPGVIDVVVPESGARARRSGIRVHRARGLARQDVTVHRGVPITTVARTLVDFSTVASAREVERVYEEAVIQRLVTLDAVADALGRAPGRNTRALRRVVAVERRLTTITRSELEERFLELLRRGGLPEPEVNARLAVYEVDFLWRDRRRVIEVDGHAFHSTRQATTRDRRKDDDLEAAGFKVTRFTADQILHDPDDTLERATRAVGKRG